MEKNWYLFVIGGLLFLQAAVFLFFQEDSYLAVHDNLDLFVTQLKMLKNTDSFFTRDAVIPMLGGISRDNLGSEFSLYNILYYILPNFWAYMVDYAFKIVIGIFSFCLLAKDIYGEKYAVYRPIICVIATAFALIPVFPAYGICFTSIPLIVYLLRRIYRKPDKWLFLGVFLYPLLSYFSYFGFFILAYIVCAVLILWIKDKHFPGRIFLSCVVLALGYVLFEHRLFQEMLFGEEVTIRSSMIETSYTLRENLKTMGEVFCKTIFHAQDSHFYLVFWVCLIGIVAINAGYLRKKDYKKMGTDPCNLVFLFLIFNVLIYGSYYWEGFRELIFTLVPQLEGFQFNRTLYFNSFLWYALFFLLLKRLYDSGKKEGIWIANIAALAALLIVMFMPQTYNDFYHTCYYHAYALVKQTEPKDLNYREFFSEELFEEIKEEIGYSGEWAVAYGMHPAVLEFNDIATLDGYLGFYSQQYKEDFRKVIAPSLQTNAWARAYYDDWGARAYVFSPSGEDSYAPYRNLELEDKSLGIDPEEFANLGGRYIFSRVEISNQEELGLELKGTYTHPASPYEIRVYEVLK